MRSAEPILNPELLAEPISGRAFVRYLQFEKRRAERRETPLSIVLFRIDAAADDPARDRQALAEVVQDSKRSTDILGRLGDGSIAILLLDTDRQGTEAFVSKVTGKTAGITFSAATGTYPDQIFENIRHAGEVLPESEVVWREEDDRSRSLEKRLKRALDLTAAMAGLIVLSPVMLLTALAVAATSPGDIIFRQVRLGRRGVPFVLYKFRSMRSDADDGIHRQYVTDVIRSGGGKGGSAKGGGAVGGGGGTAADAADKPWTKLSIDPRITPIGRILRKSGLDELPQLFNVIKGDLSIVGPRPPLPYEAEQYKAWHLRRILEMKPGITGLWQVEGAQGCSFNEMVRMDLRYSRHWSLLLDLKLIFKTIPVLALRKGAH
jgi:lipopolysaccharide/colanic/teichoic acid biosynthesis glycosyltransferase